MFHPHLSSPFKGEEIYKLILPSLREKDKRNIVNIVQILKLLEYVF